MASFWLFDLVGKIRVSTRLFVNQLASEGFDGFCWEESPAHPTGCVQEWTMTMRPNDL
jgi:hypothetical protein